MMTELHVASRDSSTGVDEGELLREPCGDDPNSLRNERMWEEELAWGLASSGVALVPGPPEVDLNGPQNARQRGVRRLHLHGGSLSRSVAAVRAVGGVK